MDPADAEFFITSPGDFASLEARIAAELHSSPDRCAFLRTALFRHLRLRALYRATDTITEDVVIPTPQGMVVRLVRGSRLVKLEWPPLQGYSGWRQEHMPEADDARAPGEGGESRKRRLSEFIDSVQKGRGHEAPGAEGE